ncbi:unnamed protein product, partial [Closterium sp. Naga37s-1]
QHQQQLPPLPQRPLHAQQQAWLAAAARANEGADGGPRRVLLSLLQGGRRGQQLGQQQKKQVQLN